MVASNRATVAVTTAVTAVVPVAVVMHVAARRMASTIGELAVVASLIAASGQRCRNNQAREDFSYAAHRSTPTDLRVVVATLPATSNAPNGCRRPSLRNLFMWHRSPASFGQFKLSESGATSYWTLVP